MKLMLIIFLLLICDVYSQNEFYQRADSLVKLMTLKEKISLLYASHNEGIPRLGIKPFNWHNECLHGVALVDHPATVFPQAISMASTFNPDLIKKVANAISDEARILYKRGIVGLNFWSPNLDIFRDPRWGRGQETYGEDPYLVSKIGNSFIQGIQGNDEFYLKSIVTLKHFVAHGGPEFERQYFNSILSNRDLWETFLPPFRSGITEAKAYSIMSAYNAINGVPCTANKYLLNDLAREKWNLRGNIFSDCWSIYFIQYDHHFVNSEVKCVAAAFNAGVDIECGMMYQEYLEKAIENNLVSEFELNKKIERILITKARLGLFENQELFKFNLLDDSLYLSSKHKELAYKNATESYILLKNNRILPFSKDIKRLMILGPNATDKFTYRGSYSGIPLEEKNLYNELVNKFGDKIQIDVEPFMYLPGKVFEPFSKNYILNSKGFQAEYYNNINFSGTPRVQYDSVIDFYWYQSAPLMDMKIDSFSVRWIGQVRVKESDEFLIRVYSDDLVKVFINDSLWLNDEKPGLDYSLVAPYFHKDSVYDIKIEFVDLNGDARLNISIANDNTGKDEYPKLMKKLQTYDAIILSVGWTPMFENERYPRDVEGIYWGDRKELELPRAQQKLIEEVSKLKIPTAMIIKSGTPVAIPFAKDNIDAILCLWYDGQEGGRASADVLFGDAVPSGKLPITFYRSTSDLPDFKDYSMDNRTYRYFKGDVLFPFGFGLSYTTFNFDNVNVNKRIFNYCIDDSITVNFDISNTGAYKAKEVAQVYIKNLDNQFDYYNKQLKGFNKIEVNFGEKINSTINISLNEFYYYDEEIDDTRVFGGLYELQFGNSSENIIWRDTILIEECNTNKVEDNYIEFEISPNPARDYIIIKNTNNIQIEKITVRDILGNIILQTDSINDFIDIRNLPNGTYFVEIQTKNQIFTRKFIKI